MNKNNNHIFSEEEDYTTFLEEMILNFLLEREVAPLAKSMRENAEHFRFISDREFSTTGGSLNFDCDKITKRVDKQLKAYSRVIEQLKAFDGRPVGEEAQQKIRYMAASLKDHAINYGYCNEALELLKVLTNPTLVGKDFATLDIKEDVLKIFNCYGKRAILEGKPAEYKDEANQLVADVICGYYGQTVRKTLTQKDMDEAFTGATVTKGDMVFKTDGTHSWKSKGKV